MALNIPMPSLPGESFLKGMEQGGNMYTRIMNPILAREKQQQLENHFQEQLKLSKAAAGRNAQLFPYRLQELKDKHAASEFERTMMSKLLSGDSGGDDQSGLLSALSQNPILRGWYKHKFGFDPLAAPKETAEEKQKLAIDKAITVDEAKAARKRAEDIENTARDLMTYAGDVQTIEGILNKKPNITGRSTQFADSLGLTKDEDVGKFISAAQSLQSHMAKAMSSRGGYGVAKLVEQGKPNIGKSGSFNKGVTAELKQKMKSSFEQMNDEYFKLKGQNLPFNFKQFYENEVGSLNSESKSNKKRIRYNPSTGRLE